MKKFVMGLTYLRMFLAPIIILPFIIKNYFFVSIILFLVASITDFFDGFLARKFNSESKLGASLDPIADKILIVFLLIGISVHTADIFVGVCSSFIIAREIFVAGLREAEAASFTKNLEVSFFAKLKTTFQFITVLIYLVGFSYDNALLIFLGSWALFLTMLITLKTGLEYFYKFLSTDLRYENSK